MKRHFRELGVDVLRDPFTCVGIGDMSGDVFGNGMLYSETIRLLAAFDHRNVFLDPEPDAGRLVRRAPTPLSAAGLLVERLRPHRCCRRAATSSTAGRRPSCPRRKRACPSAIPDDVAEEMTPDELIRWILQAPVDLLWNGGIGTYVKSSRETHADAGDRTNNSVRVNGSQVRARVVGEGGNLGFTQRGRIEYALAGGRINTDFIDNSAGVDTSDHEVNWKILLGLAIQRGELTLDARNELLQDCAPDVVQHVLYDNYLQAQILSQEDEVSTQRIEAYEDLMVQLEADGELERAVEFLPTTEEMLERRAAGHGMTRPELAVLLAYAKRQVFKELVELRSARQRLPGRRPRPLLPAQDRRTVRPSARRASAEARDHRDDRVQRCRELPGDHVRVADGHRDGGLARRRGARVPHRARHHRRGRSVGRHRGARRHHRPRACSPSC